MSVLPCQPSSPPRAASDAGSAHQVGHVFFDAGRRQLKFLNETARKLHAEGVPFTPDDLKDQKLFHLGGEPARPEDLPLAVGWREQRPVQGDFLLVRSQGAPWRVSWSAVPVGDEAGPHPGILGTVIFGPPEPDWHVLAELAHDLRTPLQTLAFLSTALEGQPPSEPQLQHALQRVRSSAGRALDIGRDLLEWCRYPVYGGRPVQSAWFPLESFLLKLAEEQGPLAQEKHLGLYVDVATASGWEVCTDRVRLGRLLSNLLSNAVRYTPAGRVEFAASWRDHGHGAVLALSVVDTGAGIHLAEQESIFEPFERGRAGKESDSIGSGLGLASVDNLVKELGVILEVQSELNRGSAFHLLLPPSMLRRFINLEGPR